MADHSFTADQIERAMAVGPSHLDSIKRAVDAGVTLVNGTDYPPGEPVEDTVVSVREMEFMVEAGLSPLDALRGATVNAARLLWPSTSSGR
jgi:imidazolonepropionase-like amidohydrolase